MIKRKGGDEEKMTQGCGLCLKYNNNIHVLCVLNLNNMPSGPFQVRPSVITCVSSVRNPGCRSEVHRGHSSGWSHIPAIQAIQQAVTPTQTHTS